MKTYAGEKDWEMSKIFQVKPAYAVRGYLEEKACSAGLE